MRIEINASKAADLSPESILKFIEELLGMCIDADC
jgi:hypothetical protein